GDDQVDRLLESQHVSRNRAGPRPASGGEAPRKHRRVAVRSRRSTLHGGTGRHETAGIGRYRVTTPYRVIVLDDDFAVADLHRRFVSEHPDFTVVAVAHSVAQAKAQLLEFRPDLLLLD